MTLFGTPDQHNFMMAPQDLLQDVELEGSFCPEIPTSQEPGLSICQLLRSLCGVMTVLDGSYPPAAPDAPAQKAIPPNVPGLTYQSQAAGTGRFIVRSQSAKLGIRNHQHAETFNSDLSYTESLLPGQVRHSKSFPVTYTLEEQYNRTEGSLLALQLKWQQQESELEHDCGAENCILYPEMMVRHAQRRRSLQMRFEQEPQQE